MTRGLFLSLDGIDGCGKSTQSARLADWLRTQGHKVVTCRDPGGTALGDQLRAIVLGQKHVLSLNAEALLFMASRAQLLAEIIRPALEEGSIVVSDRFLLANVVYQGHAGGLDPLQLWEAGRLSTDGVEPDLTLVLDLPVSLAKSRRVRTPDRMESRNDAYHERVRNGFLLEARARPERIIVLDASAAVDTVHERIVQEVRRVLEAHSGA
jgi:dTMP kinase